VTWELDAQDASDIIVYIFGIDEEQAQTSKAPITLLELGLYADQGKKIFVCCPEGYWRKGNVDIVCNRYSIELHNDIKSLVTSLKSYLDTKYWWLATY